MRLIGDANGIREEGYGMPLDRKKLDEMLEILCECMFIAQVKAVVSKRRTKHKYGQSKQDERSIVFYPIGMNEQTVLHELAHFIPAWNGSHDYYFKKAHLRLNNLWYGGKDENGIPASK